MLGILSATPAVLNGLLCGLDSFTWSHEPTPDDWALTELVCHMRDTEREIHQMQIKLFRRPEGAFYSATGYKRVGKPKGLFA